MLETILFAAIAGGAALRILPRDKATVTCGADTIPGDVDLTLPTDFPAHRRPIGGRS